VPSLVTYSLDTPALCLFSRTKYISSLVRVSTSSKFMFPNCSSLAFSSSSMVALIFDVLGAHGDLKVSRWLINEAN
jgi:hypothetical protein